MFQRIGSLVKVLFRNIAWIFSFGLLYGNKKNKSQVFKIFQPLYDTTTIGNGITQANFFQVPLGATAAKQVLPKTQVDTDMDQGGSLPYPKTYYITGVTVAPSPESSYKESMHLISNSWFRLFIGTQDYLCLPTNQVTYMANMSEYHYPGPVYNLNNPIKLLPQQNFRVEINMPSELEKLSAPIKVQVTLHGYFEYTIQYQTNSDGTLEQIYTSPDYEYQPRWLRC